ncbi:MAG: ribosomal subunit interface protein [Deltaproteobacteria bacterium]|nr:MAG: ribosomal subunit interface protein [Deltaproteobacteria bacterium]
MQVSVTFKKLDSSDALKEYVQKKLDRIEKLLDAPAEANVVLSVEKIRYIAEVSLTSKWIKIHATEETDSMYSAIDKVTDKLKKQIKKSKQKVREKRPVSKRGIKDDSLAPSSLGPEGDDEPEPSIVVETIDYKPMDIDEAMLQMRLQRNTAFFVFTNADSEQVNVLYRRADGNMGLIQPRV